MHGDLAYPCLLADTASTRAKANRGSEVFAETGEGPRLGHDMPRRPGPSGFFQFARSLQMFLQYTAPENTQPAQSLHIIALLK